MFCYFVNDLSIIFSEEGETTANNEKTLKEMGLADGSILVCDDFLQDFQIKVIVYHSTDLLEEGVEFELVGDLSKLEAPKEVVEEKKENGHENGGNILQTIFVVIIARKSLNFFFVFSS